MEDYLNIGIIVNTHGIKGECKIKPTTDDPKRYELLEHVDVDNKKKIEKYTIQHLKYFKQFVIVKFHEVNNMNEAELLKGSIVKIPRSQALPLEEDEFYISDLIGLTVKTIEDNILGQVSDIIFTGSNDVYVVKRDGKKDLLIPAIKECIKTIDLDQGNIIVELMEGLMEE